MLKVNDNCSISYREIGFETSRASGPGGQHVNKTESRVSLVFNVPDSESLRPAQKARIMDRLSTRIDSRGNLRVSVEEHRSQLTNKRLAEERFVALMQQALKPIKKRKPTRPSLSAKRKRLDSKRRRSQVKKLRGKVYDD